MSEKRPYLSVVRRPDASDHDPPLDHCYEDPLDPHPSHDVRGLTPDSPLRCSVCHVLDVWPAIAEPCVGHVGMSARAFLVEIRSWAKAQGKDDPGGTRTVYAWIGDFLAWRAR